MVRADETSDFKILCQQFFYRMASDESGSSGYEDGSNMYLLRMSGSIFGASQPSINNSDVYIVVHRMISMKQPLNNLWLLWKFRMKLLPGFSC